MSVETRIRRESDLRSKVFVSFAHEDEAAAKLIADDLERAGFSVWIDYGSIAPGTPDWEKAIREGIQSSFSIILAASPASRASQYVRRAAAVADTGSRRAARAAYTNAGQLASLLIVPPALATSQWSLPSAAV
jgi:hypothetical protein